jgi:FemAB-related protein (PEP-CTERM system-associated)
LQTGVPCLRAGGGAGTRSALALGATSLFAPGGISIRRVSSTGSALRVEDRSERAPVALPSPGAPRVERLTHANEEWDAFVAAHPEATLGHASEWGRILKEAYGLDVVQLVARDGSDGISGVLPLARFRGPAGRVELISLPFLDTAGILAADARAEAALFHAALAMGKAVELRQRRPLPGLPVASPHRVDLVLPLGVDANELWHRLPGKTRNQIRKASKQGLAWDDGSDDPVADFYPVHRSNMRELGSPVHAEAFFRATLHHLGSKARLLVARDRGRPVAALIAIHQGGAVTVPWASSLTEARPHCPNHLLYWEALCWAIDRGAEEFHFGRSAPGSGSHRFKRGWGAVEQPLFWTRARGRFADGRSVSDVRPLRYFARLWRRLPQAICDRWGPTVRRRISS